MSPPIIIWPRYLDLAERVSGIDRIKAMSIGPVVVARRELTPKEVRHEAIHVYHWVEMAAAVTALLAVLVAVKPALWLAALIVAVLSWVPGVGAYAALHGLFWLWLLARGHSRQVAYQLIPFELEAYTMSRDPEYLSVRPWFAWVSR